MSTQPSYDPKLWPYAPGNTSPEVEAVFQAEQSRWPEPTAELRLRVSAIVRRSDRNTEVSA